jgi:hypothetical protein
MKREGSEGFITKAGMALCLALLAGCAAQQQRAVNEGALSLAEAKSRAAIACSGSNQVATCMLGLAAIYGGGGGDVVPVVQSDLSAVLNSSLLGTVVSVAGQVKQSNNQTQVALAQTDASVRIAESGDARQVGIVQAATGSNTAIAGTVGTVATAGIGALGSVAQSANASNTANVAALADMTAALPPTTQITAGGSITQAGRDSDQSQTGRDRVTGNNNETARNTLCTATGGNATASLGSSSASTIGATSPINPAYNPVISLRPAPTRNNCGGG